MEQDTYENIRRILVYNKHYQLTITAQGLLTSFFLGSLLHHTLSTEDKIQMLVLLGYLEMLVGFCYFGQGRASFTRKDMGVVSII